MRLAVLLLVLAACGTDGGDARGEAANDADLTGDSLAAQDDEVGAIDEPTGWPAGKYIAPAEVYQRVVAGDAEQLLLNVSDEQFYSMGRIEGTVAIPWDLLETRLDEVPNDRHVVVYCRRGVRSESGYDTLTSNGYGAVWVMDGGLEVWLELGFPTVP